MSQVSNIARTPSNVSTLVHENYVNEMLDWVPFMDPVAGLFEELGDGGYDLIGEKLQFAADDDFAGGFMGTDGYTPDHQYPDNVELSTTPARLYVRRAVDNFMTTIAVKPGAYESLLARVEKSAMDAMELGTSFHVNGSTNATVCTFVSRTSATVLVVDAGFGHAGTAPAQYLGEEGQVLALLDANMSYATIGAAAISSIDYDTSGTTATITFASAIDASSDGADGDPLVFATTADETATHYVTERGNAPLGLLDIVDPDDSVSTLLGLAESGSQRWTPIRRASSDFGHVEIQEFIAEIGAKSRMNVTPDSHVLTLQEGVFIELAKDLLPFQQSSELGRELNGGWTTVKVGGFDFLKSMYHLHDVMYALCPEKLKVVNLRPAQIYSGDGSKFSRLADYDGQEFFYSAYLQRFPTQRNCHGALTGITNSNHTRYSAHPIS